MSSESGTMRQLDAAVAALRGVVSIAVSADALARLSDEVRLLSLRVERLKGADGRAALPPLDRSTPMQGRAADATPAIGRMPGPDILRPFAWSRRPHGDGEQRAAGHNGRSNRRGGRPASAFDRRSLLLVSGTAAILVTAFVAAMTMLQAAQPRVHVPTTGGPHRLAARQTQSFLISPVPIWSQPFKRAARDQAPEASASLDDRQHDRRASSR